MTHDVKFEVKALVIRDLINRVMQIVRFSIFVFKRKSDREACDRTLCKLVYFSLAYIRTMSLVEAKLYVMLYIRCATNTMKPVAASIFWLPNMRLMFYYTFNKT